MATLGSTLHYHCQFDVRSTDPSVLCIWTAAVAEVRTWIGGALKRHVGLKSAPNALRRNWFKRGGEWPSERRRRVLVRTRSAAVEDEDPVGLPWGLRFEHPCSEEDLRQWGIDVALSPHADVDALTVSVTISHWMLPGYLGERPEPPEPSAPGIVSQFIRRKQWRASAGATDLSDKPLLLEPGDGKDFRTLLLDPERRCPIVYMSAGDGNVAPPVSAKQLARRLAGAAIVCRAGSGELDEELSWLLPTRYRCSGGAVRVYRQGVDTRNAGDARRHRFLKSEQLSRMTQDAISSMLATSIVRRYRALHVDVVRSIEDVDAIAQTRALDRLREAYPGESESAYAQALEAQVESLNRLLEQRRQANEDLEDRLERVEQDWITADDLAKERKGELDRTKAWAKAQIDRAAAADKKVELLEGLVQLPTSLGEVVEAIQTLHPDSIVFTEEARASAADATFAEIGVAWSCLWHVATTLLTLCLQQDVSGPSLVEAFLEKSGFELAMTEKKATKRQAKMMAQRSITLDGEVFDITPHVKIGNRDPKLLRVHFAVDRKRERMVVGHCGGHLDTAGTRRRR